MALVLVHPADNTSLIETSPRTPLLGQVTEQVCSLQNDQHQSAE